MSKRIITISRQFGSGGRSIAKATAARLGIAYYDKEIIEKVADETGMSPESVAELGEYSPSRNPFTYSFVGRDLSGLSTSDTIWAAQRQVILQLAEQESCVIVGRCADFILRDRDDCLHVFIHAAMDKRAERIVERYGETAEAPEKRLKDKDKKRRINYRYYTDREWGAVENYHITLDSGAIGLDACTDIICQLAK